MPQKSDPIQDFLTEVGGSFTTAVDAIFKFGALKPNADTFMHFMRALGGDPHPEFVNHSRLTPQQVANITNFSKSNPVMHNLMMNTAPHYATVYNMARMDDEIERLPESAGGRMPVDDAVRLFGGDIGVAAFHLPENIANVPNFVGDQIKHLIDDFNNNWLPLIKSIVQLIGQIADAIKSLNPYISEYLALFRELAPALSEIKRVVLEPYLQACRNASEHMAAEKKRLADARMSMDSSVPPIIPTNYDPERIAGLAMGYNLPILGSIFRGQLSADLLEQYQAMQKRGVLTDLDFHKIAAFGSMPNPLSSVAEISSRIPDWFLQR